MSDFEVNKAVLASLCAYVDVDIVQHPHHADGVSVGLYRACGDYYEWFDYCNNPSDAWPIIKKNEISICFDYSMPSAYKDIWFDEISGAISDFRCEINDKNRLRAAMIVYLMMKDAE